MLDYFLQRNIRLGLKRYDRDHSFLNYSEINTVLILFDIEDWYEIAPIVERLKQDGKKVIAWTIKPKQSVPFKFPHFVKVIEPDIDFTWLRLFKPEIISDFERLNYDTLIDLSSGTNDYILWLVTLNKSKFCISFTERKYKLFDFVLLKEENQSMLDAYNELKRYLKNIQ
ncbi:MAG: hypothetical protein RL662_391 [Bacteroidota bacterium]|jgi:hypothetical protein